MLTEFFTVPVLGGLSACYATNVLIWSVELYKCYKKNEDDKAVFLIVLISLMFVLSWMFGNYAYYGIMYP